MLTSPFPRRPDSRCSILNATPVIAGPHGVPGAFSLLRLTGRVPETQLETRVTLETTERTVVPGMLRPEGPRRAASRLMAELVKHVGRLDRLRSAIRPLSWRRGESFSRRIDAEIRDGSRGQPPDT